MGFWEKFKIIGNKIFEFFLPLIQKFLQEGGPIAIQLALEIIPIITMTHKGVDGEAKRKEAIKQILEQAKLKGITLSMSMVSAAIEIAYAKLQQSGKV